MTDTIPWQRHVFQGTAVLIVVLLFQELIRGEMSPGIALVVAIGYVLIAEFVRPHEE